MPWHDAVFAPFANAPHPHILLDASGAVVCHNRACPEPVLAAIEATKAGLMPSLMAGQAVRERSVRYGDVTLVLDAWSACEGHIISARIDTHAMRQDAPELLGAVLSGDLWAFVILNPDGQITFANRAAEVLLELDTSDLITRECAALTMRRTRVDGSPMPNDELPYARALATRAPVRGVQTVLVWPDGRRKILDVNSTPVFGDDGDVSMVVCALHDITARAERERELREAQAALLRSEERLITATDAANLGVWEVLDVGGPNQRISWSDRMFAIYGGARDAIEDIDAFITARVPPPEMDRLGAAVAASMVTGAPFDIEFRHVWPDGTPRRQRARGRVYTDPEHGTFRLVGLSRDTTEERHLETQLIQAQKMESIGRLAGGVAHDFNNLLTAILGCLDIATLILEDDPSDSSSAVAELLEEAQEATMHGARLTQQLLAFARGSSEYHVVFDLTETLTRSRAFAERLLTETVRVALDVPSSPCWVKGDPDQTKQLILNLVTNARDAMPDGGTIHASIARVEAPPEGLGLAPKPHIVLRVRDTGVGIAATLKPLIFEPFFTTKPRSKGTGLGLSTCYGIVKRAGGALTVESTEGHGATFLAFFPESHAPEPADEADALPDPLEAFRGHETILFVEDGKLVRTIMTRALTRVGYRVIDASDGDEAITHFRAGAAPIDLIVTDVIMPFKSGPEFVRALQRSAETPPVLFVSGHPEQALEEHGFQRDAVHFLAKPFTPQQLAQNIRAILDAQQQHA